jgi:arginine:pyruvate transaminase
VRYASISDRLLPLGSNKWAVHIEGRRRAAAGDDLILLSIGEPDLPPPARVVDTAVDSIRAGRLKYSSGQGEPAARRAVADWTTRRSGQPVDPDQVVYVSGTQFAVSSVMLTLVEHGDDVLVPDPHYATYDGVVLATGARFVPVPTSPDDRFHLRADALAAAVTPASKVVLLTSPSNPTGAVLSAAELDAIGEVCIEHDLWIVCDEVYGSMTYGCEFVSPFDRPQLRDRSVSVASISKSHALPGFRSGWAVCPPEMARRLTKVVETISFGSQPFLGDALAVALNEEHPEVAVLRDTFLERARAVVAALDGAVGVRTHLPEGGMFMLLDVRDTGLSGIDFAWKLLDDEGVVVMPGESFGERGAGHVRVALTVDVPTLTEACTRIARLAASLSSPRSASRSASPST